jgi:tripartite-type tricarboxylate transporter receptor subunit TctC
MANALGRWVLLALCMSLPGVQGGAAEPYPSKIIRMVVPFPAGGPVDVMARLVSQHLTALLGQNVILDNRPGAGGTLAAKLVASAEPDGHTLLFGSSGSLAISPLLYKNIGYDPHSAFAAVAMVSNVPNVLTVTPSVPARTVAELIAHARANPGKLNYGAALGTPPHLMMELFKLATRTNIVLIPYKGAAQALIDHLADQTQVSLFAASVMIPPIQEGKVRPLAVTGVARWRQLPDVPTLAESGFADFPPGAWQGIVAPARTPPQIIAKLNAVVNEVLQSQEVRASLAKLGAEARIGPPEAFAALIAEEMRKWSAVVIAADINVD